MLCADEVLRHGVKMGPGPQNPGRREPQTQDLGPPSKFKSGTPESYPLQSLKKGQPHLSLTN